MGKVTIGLESIEFAVIAEDGGPGTTFVKYGNVSTDSLSFNEAEPTTKEVNVEEYSAPLDEFKTKGALVINANIADADTAIFAALRGGTVATTSGLKTYSEGDEFTQMEYTVKVTPAKGLVYKINRASVTGLLSGGLGKNQELFLALSVKALLPTKSGTKVLEVLETVPIIP